MAIFNLMRSQLILSHRSLTSCRFFTTIQLYKPSKFKHIKRNLYFKKKLFKLFKGKQYTETTKGRSEIKREEDKGTVFYNSIIDYPIRKKRIYMNDKYGVRDYGKVKKEEKPTLENVLFKCSTLGYLELQYILSTFVNYEKDTLTNEDICALSNFLNLSEKEICDYLSADELIPQHHLDATIIKRLLRFVHVNHPNLLIH
ncbi:hypothetical protein, conserved [Plasmodium gonderi]|uniref:Uncharacterized protein n=1 Tax=Plasmodium gonderi TaxID=77519 RepID=A0A1Y1JQ07_PLAGO|nr:hypothetical protein, conserved [Plasmodium gonderi]GAW83307.1 hypothetical protein, conserved [Plasmodium gonderi]